MHEQGSTKMGVFGANLWKGFIAKGEGTFRQGEQPISSDHEECWITKEGELPLLLDVFVFYWMPFFFVS